MLVQLARRGRSDRTPRIPGDLEDHEGDDEPDDGICARQPKRNENGADDDAE